MKMKFNLGLLKGHDIGFLITQDGKEYFIHSVIESAKQNKHDLTFKFTDNKVLTVTEQMFNNMHIEKKNGIVCFIPAKDKNVVSGYVGFSLFDTYGFPVELTEEILGEQGYKLDVVGFNTLRELQNLKSKGTFKHTSAFETA